MIFAEKLVAFMEGKKKEIAEAIGDKFSEMYFNKEDAEELLGLPEDEAKLIYVHIKRAINKFGDKGLCTTLCPFCYIVCHIARYNCHICKYGERHKVCNAKGEDSDYEKVVDEFETAGLSIHKIFSNTFYRVLIAVIEEKEDL